MLAYARVVRISGDSPAMAGNLALTSSMLRHCMLHQAEQLKGGRQWVEYPILQMLGEKRFPSPLACWGQRLYGGSGSNASPKWHRTDIPIQSGAIDKLPPDELSTDGIDNAVEQPAEGISPVEAHAVLSPWVISGLKAMSRFPTLASLREQAARLDADRAECDSDLPKIDANGIAEVAGHMAEGDQEQIPMMKGWISYLRAMGEAFPEYCVNIDETLEWGNSTVMTYSDGAGAEKIGFDHDWTYVPRVGSQVYNPQDTSMAPA